jgi:mannosylglycerate hydrolase
MPTLHLVPHTHWDREWYRTFEAFRFRLVQLIDSLLDILASDPDYRYYMLDGQTIVLEDFLQIRPERAEELKRYIREGRIQIGPWYILPDEFLVSPEATIRNLLIGKEICRQYYSFMPVGYIPDAFGHIGQMPQILQGFGIESACLWRGMPPGPSEMWWQAPDGTRVFLCNLRESYSNAWDVLADGLEGFAGKIEEKEAALAPYTLAPHRLLLFGTDHQMPDVRTSQAVRQFQEQPGRKIDLVHSTLPAYAEAAQSWLQENGVDIPVVTGELRTSPTINLLPGVLSARMWIKQRNHLCETLLERYAEPLSVWAWLTGPEIKAAFPGTRGYLDYAWRLLIQNHPHDSICGCSIDPVHEEMRIRFDKVEQVGKLVTGYTLDRIACQVDTRQDHKDCFASLLIFNPLQNTRTDVVRASVSIPPAVRGLEVVFPDGSTSTCTVLSCDSHTVARFEVDREGLFELAPLLQGVNAGYGIKALGVFKEGITGYIDVIMEQEKPSDPQAVERGLVLLQGLLEDDVITHFSIHAHTPVQAQVQFVAKDVPGFGYVAAGLQPAPEIPVRKEQTLSIGNDWLTLGVDTGDGCLTLVDHENGCTYTGLHFFSDGGDVGDEYNYSPPQQDFLLTSHASFQHAEKVHCPDHEELRLQWVMEIPARTAQDRQARSPETLPMEISSRVSVYPSLKRVDFKTRITQTSDDHRVRVHFPVPFTAESAFHDGHFEVVERTVLPPWMEEDWTEQRRPEVPQRAFTDMADGKKGLMLAVCGLPEVAVQHRDNGNMEAALTLLRCVGWLSRDDFSTRRGHAGPMLATPGAQMHGTYTLSYALIPHGSSRAQAMADSYGFSTPLTGQLTSMHEGRLPSAGSFLGVQPDSFQVTAIKPSEDRTGWIVRGTNMGDESLQCTLQFHVPVSQVYFTNLAEEILESVELDAEGKISFPVPAHKIITLKVIAMSV